MVTLGNLNQIDAPADVTTAIQAGQTNQNKVNRLPVENEMQDIQLKHDKLQQAKQQIDIAAELLGSSVDQASYDANRAKAQQLGLDVSKEPTVFDPNYIKQTQMHLLPLKDQLDIELAKAKGALQQQLLQAQIGTEGAQKNSFNALSNQRNSAAGLNNANTQAVLHPTVAPSPGAPNPMQPIGKPPSGYQWTSDGKLSFIPGGPHDPAMAVNKPLNNDQANAATYSSRMADADSQLRNLEAKGYTPNPLSNSIGDSDTGNALVGEDTQKFIQARRNFINAVLRKESGAAISQSEFENANKQYFPQFGDKPGSVQQKALARQRAIEGMKRASGPAAKVDAKEDPLGLR